MKKKSKKYYELLENIAAMRKDKGLSQDNIADSIGLKQSGYGLIESGERGLDYERLLQIAIALNVSVIDLIAYPEKLKPVGLTKSEDEGAKVILQIELKKEKKDQVMKLVFGDNNIEILNK